MLAMQFKDEKRESDHDLFFSFSLSSRMLELNFPGSESPSSFITLMLIAELTPLLLHLSLFDGISILLRLCVDGFLLEVTPFPSSLFVNFSRYLSFNGCSIINRSCLTRSVEFMVGSVLFTSFFVLYTMHCTKLCFLENFLKFWSPACINI